LIHISAKTGFGIEKVFRAIVELIPPPVKPKSDVLKCFLFDARFVPTRGVACLVKVM
jgi:translation elongation factor EF-4